jgi:histidinol dehydrogenase
MNVISWRDADFAAQVERLLAPSSLFDPAIEQQTRGIIEAVQTRGDAALTELTERFNGARLEPERFAVSQAELVAASLQADQSLRAATAARGARIGPCATATALWSGKNSIPSGASAFIFPAGRRRWFQPRS